MDKKKVLEILLGNKYYTIQDLRYNNEIGLFLSKDELKDFLNIKDTIIEEGYYVNNHNLLVKIPLKTFYD